MKCILYVYNSIPNVTQYSISTVYACTLSICNYSSLICFILLKPHYLIFSTLFILFFFYILPVLAAAPDNLLPCLPSNETLLLPGISEIYFLFYLLSMLLISLKLFISKFLYSCNYSYPTV